MADDTTGSAVEQASLAVGKPAATVLLSTDADEKPFIAEAFVIGATVFLLQRYAEGFLIGLGFDDMAERHGKRARGFLSRLRSGNVEDAELAAAREEAEAAVSEVRHHPPDPAGRREAERAVATELIEAGSIRAAAEDIARGLSAAVLAGDGRG